MEREIQMIPSVDHELVSLSLSQTALNMDVGWGGGMLQ